MTPSFSFSYVPHPLTPSFPPSLPPCKRSSDLPYERRPRPPVGLPLLPPRQGEGFGAKGGEEAEEAAEATTRTAAAEGTAAAARKEGMDGEMAWMREGGREGGR